MSGILQIPTGAAASVSHHKSIVTESYQRNSRGVSSLVIRDLQVPLHLVEPDFRGLVVETRQTRHVDFSVSCMIRQELRLLLSMTGSVGRHNTEGFNII